MVTSRESRTVGMLCRKLLVVAIHRDYLQQIIKILDAENRLKLNERR